MKKIKIIVLTIVISCSFIITYGIYWDSVGRYPSFTLWQIEDNMSNPVRVQKGANQAVYIEAIVNSTFTEMNIDMQISCDGISINVPLSGKHVSYLLDDVNSYKVGDVLRVKFPLSIPTLFPWNEGDLTIMLNGNGGAPIAAGRVHVIFEN